MAYKLTYFEAQGRGEPIRFLLSYGGIDFEDKRVDKETWPAFKSNTPFGQLPIFEYEGKTTHQSVAICRYIAKQVKLVGKDDWENLEIDAAVDTVMDMLQLMITMATKGEGLNLTYIANIFYVYLEKKIVDHWKAAPETTFKDHFLKEDVKDYLGKLDKQIEKNNGYLAAGRLTWADLLFVPLALQLVGKSDSEVIADYPNIQGIVRKVVELPRIKEWLEKHPTKE